MGPERHSCADFIPAQLGALPPNFAFAAGAL